MRRYTISPTVIDAMRRKALAARMNEVQVPLYLPAFDERQMALMSPSPHAYDAEDARVVAGGITIGDDEDDDFY